MYFEFTTHQASVQQFCASIGVKYIVSIPEKNYKILLSQSIQAVK